MYERFGPQQKIQNSEPLYGHYFWLIPKRLLFSVIRFYLFKIFGKIVVNLVKVEGEDHYAFGTRCS
ncbi:MAG: hypothetical protein ABS948_12440 [Solibacillus sp.]